MQREVNAIWQKVWTDQRGKSAKKILGSRLSVESYAVIKPYITQGAQLILEVGTGSGRFAVQFAHDHPAAKVVATDILEESLSGIHGLARELGIYNLETKREDIFHLSFPDDSFDVVFSDAVIQHLPEYQRAVAEMARVVKPGGRLIVSVVNYWNPHTMFKALNRRYEYGYEKSFTKRELRRAVEGAGLRIVAQDGFYVGYGVYRLKKYHPIFSFLGRALNRISKILDRVTNRFFSKTFGFEIVIVGEK